MATRKEAVARALPALNRPRLKTESEAKFAELEQACAVSYTEIETITENLQDLAKKMDAEDADTQTEAVPVEVDSWEDDSLVHHVEELRAAAKTDH